MGKTFNGTKNLPEKDTLSEITIKTNALEQLDRTEDAMAYILVTKPFDTDPNKQLPKVLYKGTPNQLFQMLVAVEHSMSYVLGVPEINFKRPNDTTVEKEPKDEIRKGFGANFDKFMWGLLGIIFGYLTTRLIITFLG